MHSEMDEFLRRQQSRTEGFRVSSYYRVVRKRLIGSVQAARLGEHSAYSQRISFSPDRSFSEACSSSSTRIRYLVLYQLGTH